MMIKYMTGFFYKIREILRIISSFLEEKKGFKICYLLSIFVTTGFCEINTNRKF